MSAPSSKTSITVDLRKLALGVGLLGLALGGSALGLALANSNSSPSSSGTIQVSATAEQSGKPDTLSLQLAVTTNSSSAAKALNKNNTEMSHLQSIFKSHGATADDLQTTGLSVGPTYNNKGNVDGYSAEDDLSVTMHGISKDGAVIDAAENAVGNDVSISSVTFSLSNDSALLRSTRELAMQDAHQKALEFARGGNEQLGSIEQITLESSSTPPPISPLFAAAAGVHAKANAPVPLQGGTQQVSVEVQVTYRLVL